MLAKEPSQRRIDVYSGVRPRSIHTDPDWARQKGFRTTLAHNTLSVDEKSQQPAQGRCEAFVATNGFSAVMAEAGHLFQGGKIPPT